MSTLITLPEWTPALVRAANEEAAKHVPLMTVIEEEFGVSFEDQLRLVCGQPSVVIDYFIRLDETASQRMRFECALIHHDLG